jgi:stage V sporulation protein R
MGLSAQRFAREIEFGLEHKREALHEYLNNRQWFKQESWTDEVATLEPGVATVYDLSVEETHRYAANGLINHNSYWHSTIMTQSGVMTHAEVVDYADHHSGTVALRPGRLNPYKLGLELFRDIEERWNKGRFGKEYEECDDAQAKANWDLQLGLGREKIFEVRRVYNDVGFIDTFLTEEFAREHKLFTFAYNPRRGQYEIESREFEDIKKKLLFMLTNGGNPIIYVQDANYANRGELLLVHQHEGVDLQLDYARDTLENIYKLWTRPVHLDTIVDDAPRRFTFDGTDHRTRRL